MSRTVYLESSALLAWLLGEARAGDVQEALDSATTVVISVLTLIEAERALIRAEQRGSLRSGDASRLRGILARSAETWIRMDLHADVLSRAARPFPVEPVRTLDAFHLATALIFTTAFADLRVCSFDRRLRENATALGIA